MPEHQHPHLLGIDFGTSNSAAAMVGADGRLHALKLDEGSTSMPTALFFSSEDGTVAYGRAAMQAYLEGHEGRLMRSIKSLLGSSLINEQTLLNGRMVSLFEVVVLFFKELKRRCERELGHPVDAALLGRPVHFVDDDAQRDAQAQATLGEAAYAAGFTSVQFQLEPIAAAFDYEQRITAEGTVLVVDIGGGTSDFTVARVGHDRAVFADRGNDILATTGVHIGGTDFDQLLNLRHVMPLLGLGHVGPHGRSMPSSLFHALSTWHLVPQCYTRKSLHDAAQLRSDYTEPALHKRLMHVLHERQGHRILAHTEAAKIECSNTRTDAQIALDCIERGLGVPLTPAGLDATLQAQVASIVACAQACVARSGVPANRLQALYLTGGSSALAPLGVALGEAFPGAQLVTGDRLGSVAAGLAYGGAAVGRAMAVES